MAYDETVKAQVIAALLTGEGVSEVARKFNMPKTTVFRFKSELVPERMEQIGTEKRERIDDLLLESEEHGTTRKDD